MASFETALPWVLRHEGGWSDDPLDRGGATMYGITLAVAQRHGIPDALALRGITPQQAADIYRKDYWRFDGIVNQNVATKVFDIAVNCGLSTAVKMLQKAVGMAGHFTTVDGDLGPKTLEAVNACHVYTLMSLLVSLQRSHYQRIVDRSPEQIRFLKGWMRRADEVPE